MTRDEYLIRSVELAPRGNKLPHAKLSPDQVECIRSSAKQRDRLRQHIRDNLSNESLAMQFGVHVRTVEKVLQGYTWSHV